MAMENAHGARINADDGPKSEKKALIGLYFMYKDDMQCQEPEPDDKIRNLLISTGVAEDNNNDRRRAEQVHPNDDSIQRLLVVRKQPMSLKLYPSQVVHGFRLLPYVSYFPSRSHLL